MKILLLLFVMKSSIGFSSTLVDESALIIQGSVSSVAIAFLQEAVLRMIPYAIPGIMLVILDLIFGIRAANFRGERVRFSTALRRTMTKTFSYICFIILASTLALAFSQNWLEWLVLGLVYTNEFASIVGNYLETKGLVFSFKAFYRWLFKKAGQHMGIEVTDEEAAEMLKSKPKIAKDDVNNKTQ